MRLLPVRLSGPLLVEPLVSQDSRGFFFESYRRDLYRDAGMTDDFVQDNHSRSLRGTIRALHFQAHPGQPKLVRVARGRVWDVVVDIRPKSPTFGEWEAFELDDQRNLQLYVPVGFAHGFCALSEVADLVYKVGSYYDAATERGIAWNDPDIGIAWPTLDPLLSERDRDNPPLAAIRESLPDW